VVAAKKVALSYERFVEIVEGHGVLVDGIVLRSLHKEILKALDKAGGKTNEFIAEWIPMYSAAKGYEWVKTGPELQAAKGIVADLESVEKAVLYAAVYLTMRDGWFETRRHDLQTLRKNLQAVNQKIKTGRATTATEAKRIDKAQANANAFSTVLEKRRGRDGA
jgi:hypothetical protein